MTSTLVCPTANANAAEKRPLDRVLPQKGSSGAIFAACLLFFLLNFGLWKWDEKCDFSPGRKTMQQFDLERTIRELPPARRINFIGSSLINYPLWKADLGKFTQCGDANHYHESKAFAELLKAQGLKDVDNYDLAIGGSMISDVYLLVRNYVGGGNQTGSHSRPKTLIFGCAPRDFYDNNAPTPASTLVYRHLFPIDGIFAQQGSLYERDFWKRAWFFLNRTVFLINHNREITNALVQWCDSTCTALLAAAQPAPPCPVATVTQTPAVPSAAATPVTAVKTTKATIFDRQDADNEQIRRNAIAEYTARYRNISEAAIEPQSAFAAKLVDLCKQRGIKLVVVNMPLSSENRALLPSGFYEHFCSRVDSIFRRDGVRYLDLSSAPDFSDADFDDTVHLNGEGGVKFLQHVSAILR